MQNENQQTGDAGHRTSPALIAIVWIVVLIPLAWGFTSTLIEASKLFW